MRGATTGAGEALFTHESALEVSSEGYARVFPITEASARFRFWEATPEGGAGYYSRRQIQPIQYIEANELPYHEAAIVKYVTRWQEKNGIEDLNKALFFLRRLIQLQRIADGGPNDGTR